MRWLLDGTHPPSSISFGAWISSFLIFAWPHVAWLPQSEHKTRRPAIFVRWLPYPSFLNGRFLLLLIWQNTITWPRGMTSQQIEWLTTAFALFTRGGGWHRHTPPRHFIAEVTCVDSHCLSTTESSESKNVNKQRGSRYKVSSVFGSGRVTERPTDQNKSSKIQNLKFHPIRKE